MAEPVIGANSTGSNRKVWVVNHNRDTYVEDFRGEKISVPGGEQKRF